MKAQIIHPKVLERQQNPMKHVRDNAGQLIIEQLEKFKKKIPKKGLNNKVSMWRWKATDYPEILPFGRNEPIPELPTLPRRMEKLFWHALYLPPQMVAMGMTSEDFDKSIAKSLIADCFELLFNLLDNLDSVIVVDRTKIESWKKRIQAKIDYLRVTAKMLGLIQEGEYKVVINNG